MTSNEKDSFERLSEAKERRSYPRLNGPVRPLSLTFALLRHSSEG